MTDNILGILWTFFALAFFLYSFLRLPRRNRRPVEEHEEAIEKSPIEVQKPVHVPLPPPLPSRVEESFLQDEEEKFAFRPSLERYHPTTAIETRHLGVDIGSGDTLVSSKIRALGQEGTVVKSHAAPPVRVLLNRLPRKQMLVVATELLLPPIGLRKSRN